MLTAIGLVELNSIAKGIEAADAMLKSAQVEILTSRPICPGKYIVLISGDVAAVESAVRAGVNLGEAAVVDEFILPNVHPAVIPAISATTPAVDMQALGIIETFSIASLIVAADTAVKAAEVDLIEIRLGTGIGGKSFVTLTGDVAAVKAAVEAGSASVAEKGLLLNKVVIPSPHRNLVPSIM
jgi:microcompartment protein CcmL/EutN